MTKEELKQQVCAAIEKRADEFMAIAKDIFQEPELGFKEVKTSQKIQDVFTKLKIPFEKELAITGVKGRLKGKSSQRTVAVIGELDAIICRAHSSADETTGAAHCCGHNVQIANMLGIAMALQDTNAMQYLNGDVALFAVPAEECIEIEYRNALREKGKLHYFGGKQELIYLGHFDDIDAAMQMHVAHTESEDGDIAIGGPCNGFISKLIEYKGRASHAAMAPDKGINALNAAMLGIMGVNALRETFREDDYIRFHPIITSGGDLVNVVPDFVRMESYVRASNPEALINNNERIDNALKAGAMAVGATCEVHNLPGYLPMIQDQNMTAMLAENCADIFGESNIIYPPPEPGSTDMGDVSQLIPIIHPWVGCIHGALHSADFEVVFPKTAYIKSAQVLAMTLIDLLYGQGEGLEKVLSEFTPKMTKEQYIAYMTTIEKM